MAEQWAICVRKRFAQCILEAFQSTAWKMSLTKHLNINSTFWCKGLNIEFWVYRRSCHLLGLGWNIAANMDPPVRIEHATKL